MNNFIIRQKSGKSFAYYDGDQKVTDPAVLDRISRLAIPPAWQKVIIARSSRSKVQAMGYDKAGRRQAIYSPTYQARQEAAKFERVQSFAKHLPMMRQQIDHDLSHKGLPKDKVLACVVKLMDTTYFRVGNEVYARDHQTYGITTLRSKHTDVHGSTVTFDFTGKSGKEHHKSISDRQIARLVRKLDELPGYEIFKYYDEHGHLHPVSSADVNGYIKEHMGEEYTAKDYRTWGGTLLAAVTLRDSEQPSSERERKKAVTKAVKTVARELGNTPAVARSSYIDPRIIKTYLTSNLLAELAQASTPSTPYLQPDESYVVHVLEVIST